MNSSSHQFDTDGFGDQASSPPAGATGGTAQRSPEPARWFAPQERDASPLESESPAGDGPGADSQSAPNQSAPNQAPDPTLVQETRNQIRQLVQELHTLAQSDARPDEFYDQFLSHVVSALAALGGAIWAVQDSGVSLQYQINMAATGLGEDPNEDAIHEKLLSKIASRGQPLLVPPQSGPADNRAESPDRVDASHPGAARGPAAETPASASSGNPTDFLLIVAPVMVEKAPRLLIEIFQRPGGGPTTQRGYLRFLTQMSDLASDYFTRRHLQSLHERQQLWERLEQYLQAIHRPMRLEETCYALVNEGRRLIECDRLSVVVSRRHRYRVEAVSGLDTLDRRAQEVTLLGRLATAVVEARKPLWYAGDPGELPPQIERPLHAYLDQSHTKLLGIIPLVETTDSDDAEESAGGGRSAGNSGAGSHRSRDARQDRQPPLGALIVEQLHDETLQAPIQHRAELASQHASFALDHALRHHRVPLRPVWEWLDGLRWLTRLRNIPWTVATLGLLICLIALLFCYTAPLRLPSSGRLLPVVRRDIFAAHDGVVVEVPVRHDQIVDVGHPLARLRSTDLEVQISGLVGQQMTVEEQIRSKQNVLLKNPRLDPLDQDRIHGELLELRETAKNVQEQLDLHRRKLAELTIYSPMAGRVVTWQVEQMLLHRPVQRGQVLMTIADPESEWEIELDVPERRLGHLVRAQEASDRPLPVTFMVATHPGEQFVGQIVEIQRTAEPQPTGESTVRVRVAIDADALPELHHGATIHAKLECGELSLGYVWFYDLIETVQTKVLFWWF